MLPFQGLITGNIPSQMTALHLPECSLENTVNLLNILYRVILLPVIITHHTPVSFSRDAKAVSCCTELPLLSSNCHSSDFWFWSYFFEPLRNRKARGSLLIWRAEIFPIQTTLNLIIDIYSFHRSKSCVNILFCKLEANFSRYGACS